MEWRWRKDTVGFFRIIYQLGGQSLMLKRLFSVMVLAASFVLFGQMANPDQVHAQDVYFYTEDSEYGTLNCFVDTDSIHGKNAMNFYVKVKGVSPRDNHCYTEDTYHFRPYNAKGSLGCYIIDPYGNEKLLGRYPVNAYAYALYNAAAPYAQ